MNCLIKLLDLDPFGVATPCLIHCRHAMLVVVAKAHSSHDIDRQVLTRLVARSGGPRAATAGYTQIDRSIIFHCPIDMRSEWMRVIC